MEFSAVLKRKLVNAFPELKNFRNPYIYFAQTNIFNDFLKQEQ